MKTETELCENCEERPGDLNSTVWKEEGEDIGHWVCFECEQELQEDHDGYMEWLTSGIRYNVAQ